jgi:hypothetical protein
MLLNKWLCRREKYDPSTLFEAFCYHEQRDNSFAKPSRQYDHR